MKTKKFRIHIGRPWAEVTPQDHDVGWCRTLEAAIARAERMTKYTRTDCGVGVSDGERMLAVCGTHSGPAGYVRTVNPA